MHHRRTTCRSCGSTELHQFLSLGPTPLANAFLQSPAEFAGELSFPLDVFFCARCTLVQLVDVAITRHSWPTLATRTMMKTLVREVSAMQAPRRPGRKAPHR